MSTMLDLSEIGFVKRITIGTRDPQAVQSHQEIEHAVNVLNRALSDIPRGRIIAIERSFHVFTIQDNVVVLQWICYHLGFPRRPAWLTE
ncbi:MAG: hypothetical protein ABIS14_11590 [Sphingomonas sp.]